MRTELKGDGLPMGWMLVFALVDAGRWIAIALIATRAAVEIARIVWG
jgi:hypothetical protein